MSALRRIPIFFKLILFVILGITSVSAAPFDAEKAFSQTYRIFCVLPSIKKNGDTYSRWSTGSGFLVSNNEFIATNSHVIEGASGIYVLQIRGETIKVWKAAVYSDHEGQDLAILKVPGLTGTPVTFAESVPKPAEKVWAVGFPGQADNEAETSSFRKALSANNYSDFPANPSYNNYVDPTVRDGSIESIRTLSWKTGSEKLRIITHDANMTKGNSGGPLFLANGDVIGVNTQIHGEGRNSNGVLVGNIMRKSSLFTELTMILDRLDINYQRRKAAQTPNPADVATPTKKEDPPNDTKEKPTKSSKKRSTGFMAQTITFAEDNVGYIAIGLGTLIALIALYFGLRNPSQTEPSPPQQASTPTPASPPPPRQAPSIPRNEQNSVPITPVQHQPAKLTSHPACQIRSTSDSPVKVAFDIRANEIPPKGFIMGRSSTVSGRISHSSVSRTHAKLKVSNGSLYVSDAGSSNGTIVGKKKLEPKTGMILENKDTIQLGEITLIVTF